MVDKKKSKTRKRKKSKKDSNVVDLFTGDIIPVAAKVDSVKAIKKILKDGGLKDRSFILITYNPDTRDRTYYSSGDSNSNVVWELEEFILLIKGLRDGQ